MQFQFSVLSLIVLFGLGQALFLGLASLVSGPGPRISRRLLTAFLCTLAIGLANGLYYETGFYEQLSFFIGLPVSLQFLVAPLLWYYVRALNEEGFRLGPGSLFHLLPALICLLLQLPFLLEGSFYKMALMYTWLHDFRPNDDYLVRFWFELALPVQAAIYLGLVWHRIRTHEQQIRELFSNIDYLTLAWLRKVVVAFALGMTGLVLSWILLIAGYQMNGVILCVPLANCLMVYYLSWHALTRNQRPLRLTSLPLPAPLVVPTDSAPADHPKYQKSKLSIEYCRRILDDLDRLLIHKKPYLDYDLTLVGLADQLRISRNHLSQVLNQHLKTTFYDYINRFRLKEVAARLVDQTYAELGIIDIASDCGFNTKSTFNKAFKEWYGVSPSEYRAGLRCPRNAGTEGDKGVPPSGRPKPKPPMAAARS